MEGDSAQVRSANEFYDGAMYDSMNEEGNSSSLAETQVMVIYPPTAEPTAHTLVNTVILICCLTLGICGNASQVALQWYANRLRIVVQGTPNCSQMLICILHLVYFGISASLPSVIIENLVKIWMFGTLSCRGHFIFSTAGRTIAAWSIAFLFLDQYFLLLAWKKARDKIRSFFFCTLAVMCVVTCVVVVPTLFFVKINEVVLHEERTTANTLLRIRTFTCSTQVPKRIAVYVGCVNGLLEYALPLTIVALFCSRTTARPTAEPLAVTTCQKRISKSLMILASMHFVAYLPQWISLFLSLIREKWKTELSMWPRSLLNDATLLLPQLNAGLAWMPASYLSAQLSALTSIYEFAGDAASPRIAPPKRSSSAACGGAKWSNAGTMLKITIASL